MDMAKSGAKPDDLSQDQFPSIRVMPTALPLDSEITYTIPGANLENIPASVISFFAACLCSSDHQFDSGLT